jgi:sugar phosphate isomerase/epimerase
MKLAVSNIAWPEEASSEIADMLREHGVTGIEVAPTKLLGTPATASDEQIDACRAVWQDRGLPIVAAQALLFGQGNLLLFADEPTRHQTLDYLRAIVRTAGRLGAGPLVFGSPKNRRRGEVPLDVAWPIAIDFFRQLGESATAAGSVVVLEANPTEYGADFLTSAVDALQLTREIDHPGIGLHLDTACMQMAGDDPQRLIEQAEPWLRHFHVSEPNLAPVGSAPFPHASFARSLAKLPYDGWISIEMRTPEPFSVDAIRQSVDFVREVYGGAGT